MAATKQNKKRKRRAREHRWMCPNCDRQMLTQKVACSRPCDIFYWQKWRFEDDPRRSDIRQQVLRRDRGSGCRKCGAGDRQLDVHHLSYRRQGEPAEVDDCVLLCRGCHDWVHRYLRERGVRPRLGDPARVGLQIKVRPVETTRPLKPLYER